MEEKSDGGFFFALVHSLWILISVKLLLSLIVLHIIKNTNVNDKEVNSKTNYDKVYLVLKINM